MSLNYPPETTKTLSFFCSIPKLSLATLLIWSSVSSKEDESSFNFPSKICALLFKDESSSSFFLTLQNWEKIENRKYKKTLKTKNLNKKRNFPVFFKANFKKITNLKIYFTCRFYIKKPNNTNTFVKKNK